MSLITLIRRAITQSDKVDRAMAVANAPRTRRWEATPEAQRIKTNRIPAQPFGPGIWHTVQCARINPRPKGRYLYHYWTDYWVVPCAETGEILP